MERANGTLKKKLTKAILDNVKNALSGEAEVEELRSTAHNWVKVFHHQAELYNNTPKVLTKRTPLEVHFPERMGIRTDYSVTSEEDKRILLAHNEEVSGPIICSTFLNSLLSFFVKTGSD